MTINNINDLSSYLASLPVNNKNTPYLIELKIKRKADFKALRAALNGAMDKYVYLDLSGSTIKNIPDFAFFSLDNLTLTGILIPNSVNNIGQNTFSGCTNLKNVIMPSSLINIGFGPFQKCTSLENITIPDSVKNIGVSSFWHCSSLTSVTIPDSVTSIGDNAFGDCTSLSAINVTDGNSAYTSQNGILYNKDKTALIQYPAGKKSAFFTIPNGITDIGESAFQGCSLLKSIVIPNGITDIGFAAFEGCTGLESVTIPDIRKTARFT